LQFRSKQRAFLDYSGQHKGYRCLDIATGRIYISRDVVFDESVFPFSTLNPNAGAQLLSEISVLPSHIRPMFGDIDILANDDANPANYPAAESFM
jgi:histone deacetylase 1/2